MTSLTIPGLDRTLLNLKRSREIIQVLLSHGFADILVNTGVADLLLERLGINFPLPVKKETIKYSRSERVRRVCEDLGPTFIKIGQILSTRSDLFPPELIVELKKLQSQCIPVPFSEIMEVLREELGEQIESAFLSIDSTPLGTASLAQSHKAVLQDGSVVALKILKPGITEQLEADLGILRELAQLSERYLSNLGFSPTEVCDEFADEIRREVDYRAEAKATEKLAGYFSEDPDIAFPKVYQNTSTSKVLTLEYINGCLLSHLKDGYFGEAERRRAVTAIVRAVFKQCLEYGFFHADPHQGNIFVFPDGRVCFIDCGMTGHLDDKTSAQIAKLCHMVIAGDVEGTTDILLTLTDADLRLTRRRSFRGDVWKIVSRFQDSTLKTLHVGSMLSEFFELLRTHSIRCPSDIVFLIKSLSTVEGVAEELDPHFDVVSFSRPFLERLIKERYGFEAIWQRAGSAMVDYAELVEKLPRYLDNLFDRVLAERFSIHLEHNGLDNLTRSIERLTSYLSRALMASSLIVGSSILVLADKVANVSGTPTIVGSVGFVIAFVYILRLSFYPK